MRMDEAIPYVKRNLTDDRFQHSLRVVEQALELAVRYGVDREKAGLAAVFHDYAKDLPLEDLQKVIMESSLPKELLQYHHELWHGPVGSVLMRREFGVQNIDIQDAVRYHTTGRAGMSQLELVIYVADYIEPARNFPGVEEVRKIAQEDLSYAAWIATRNTIRFLLEQQALIYPDTNAAYNDLTHHVFQANQ